MVNVESLIKNPSPPGLLVSGLWERNTSCIREEDMQTAPRETEATLGFKPTLRGNTGIEYVVYQKTMISDFSETSHRPTDGDKVCWAVVFSSGSFQADRDSCQQTQDVRHQASCSKVCGNDSEACFNLKGRCRRDIRPGGKGLARSSRVLQAGNRHTAPRL